MRSLEHAAVVMMAYGDAKKSAEFRADAASVREALLRAVHSVHPGSKLEIPISQLEACVAFLGNFQSIFTTNYDLLLYWVILQRPKQYTDGFAHGNTVEGFRTFSSTSPCNIYFLHGALHLFLGERRETRKRIVTGDTIIDDIESTIRKSGQLPLFISEGQWTKKLAKINSVSYLQKAFQHLKQTTGSIFIFGHSAHPNDRHIYGALFSSKIQQLFFCVRNADGLADYQEKLAPFSVKNPGVEIIYVDAASARVWG